jgi:hypothetical protein
MICSVLSNFDSAFGGERGIRTPGPLCHLSAAKIHFEPYLQKKLLLFLFLVQSSLLKPFPVQAFTLLAD